MPDILKEAQMRVRQGKVELVGWGLRLPRVQELHPRYHDKPWYFIGDLHGDFLAWHTLLQRVKETPDFRICFMGDLVDRGPHSVECFASVMQASFDFPDQILWIAGNHDIAVEYRPDRPFDSNVQPAEFVDWLNARGPERRPWGELFVDVCKRLPRAVLFPDGLLATHGGIPLGDRWSDLVTQEALQHPRVLDDFTWTRSATVPRRKGYMHCHKRAFSSSYEYGHRDFADFCEAVKTVLPVQRIIRGHDHVGGGWEQPKEYGGDGLTTITGFGFNPTTSGMSNYRKSLTLGYLPPGKGEQLRSLEVPVREEDRSAFCAQSDAPDDHSGHLSSRELEQSSLETRSFETPSPQHSASDAASSDASS